MKKLFINEKFFLTVTLLGFLGLLIGGTLAVVLYPDYSAAMLPYTIIALCLLFLRSSYVKHSKNVMKGLMGALLMAGLLHAIGMLSAMLLPVDKIVTPIVVGLSVLLFVSHYYINSDHHSSPRMIVFNQVLCALLAVVYLVWDVIWACSCGNGLAAVGSFALGLGEIGLYAAVVCVESRLDAYRIAREDRGYKA